LTSFNGDFDAVVITQSYWWLKMRYDFQTGYQDCVGVLWISAWLTNPVSLPSTRYMLPDVSALLAKSKF